MTVTSSHASGRPTPARDRLVAAANELFYAEGIHTVGVDRIIEHAGVSRASFYNNFDSKEHLIHTYLMGRYERSTDGLTEVISTHDNPRAKILAVFDAQAELLGQPEFNGCPFVAATCEAPSGGTIATDAVAFRSWIRALFFDLASQAEASDPDELARQLHLLYDGAGLTARMDRDPDVAKATRRAVVVILDAALPS